MMDGACLTGSAWRAAVDRHGQVINLFWLWLDIAKALPAPAPTQNRIEPIQAAQNETRQGLLP